MKRISQYGAQDVEWPHAPPQFGGGDMVWVKSRNKDGRVDWQAGYVTVSSTPKGTTAVKLMTSGHLQDPVLYKSSWMLGIRTQWTIQEEKWYQEYVRKTQERDGRVASRNGRPRTRRSRHSA